jgi:hypothetical protein
VDVNECGSVLVEVAGDVADVGLDTMGVDTMGVGTVAGRLGVGVAEDSSVSETGKDALECCCHTTTR